MAREKADRGETMSSRSSKKSGKSKYDEDSMSSKSKYGNGSHGLGGGSGDPMEPEILL